MTTLRLAAAAAALSLAAGAAAQVTVTVGNALDFPRSEMVELDASAMLGRLGTPYATVTDAAGAAVPCQLTHDGLLIFPVNVDASSDAIYTLHPAKEAPSYSTIATGRRYPERNDDIAWENENAGFRAYGPATQRNGERAFGYDIFFKHPTPEPVLEKLYAAQTSSENWRKVDSLRRIDRKLAADFQNSFTYHVDHGMGMDCYAVGATLGDGVAVPLEGDSLEFAWCYDTAEILDNGPLRFTMLLHFAPRTVGATAGVAEHRKVSLDAGGNLNRTRVWYDGLDRPVTMAAGFPLRDATSVMASPKLGTLSYSDPTQGPDNGRAMLGLVIPGGNVDLRAPEGHATVTTPLPAGETFDYLWGFAWDRGNYPDMQSWDAYLARTARALQSPLTVTIQ